MSARDERIKLTANYLNGLAIAVFALGSFSPLIAVVLQRAFSGRVVFVAVICFVLSGALHWLGRRRLRGLDE